METTYNNFLKPKVTSSEVLFYLTSSSEPKDI